MALATLLTRVQYIGLSNIRLDFDGRYYDSLSDWDEEDYSFEPLLLKKLVRMDCLLFIDGRSCDRLIVGMNDLL